MIRVAVALLAVFFIVSTASAKNLRFTYDCNATQFKGNQEVALKHPTATKYLLVKTASPRKKPKAGQTKWVNHFSIEISLQGGALVSLPLVHSGSGDEGYESYHIPVRGAQFASNSQFVDQFWISSGSIFNDGSGGSFEGQTPSGALTLFECR